MTYLEVAQTLENFVSGKGKEWDWDDYISAVSFKDPYLHELQVRMNGLSAEFPSTSKGHYCSEEGLKIIRQYIEELRTKA